VALPRTFDPIFDRHRGSIPRNFLRALAWSESRLNPQSSSGPAWGLMQLLDQVRVGFNERYGAGYAREQLLDPNVNVQIGTDLIKRIAAGYAKHPDRNMKTNWGNPEFVKLVVAGWNSGYSEGGGVGKVASYLEQRGIPVTHDAVFQHAAAAGATVHLQNDAKRRWQAGVVQTYFGEGGPEAMGLMVVAIAAAGLAYLIYKYV
jgi:hypothetical protein